MRSPRSSVTDTPAPSSSKPVTRLSVRSSISSCARQASSSGPWMCGAMRDRVGVAEALLEGAPQGMLATSSPVTASIIRSRSIISAFFFAAAPTPSASSTDSALGATWRPTPTSPNSRACSSTSERKPCRASASAQASPPMPPPAIATGCALRAATSSGLIRQSRRRPVEPALVAGQRLQFAQRLVLGLRHLRHDQGSPSPLLGWQENSRRMSFGSNT